MSEGAGKGDRRRPVDREKYAANFAEIFRKFRKEEKKKKKGKDKS
tara:strand:- start:21 stop:155 length:135 start_codon:yes stop_codon:yes gene_type:complete